MKLKIDYKDDVYSGLRKYRKKDNIDGTISLEDVTLYTTEGSVFSASDFNQTNRKINELENIVSSIPKNAVDHVLSETSDNPVANSVITKKLKREIIKTTIPQGSWNWEKVATITNNKIKKTAKITIDAVPFSGENPDSSYLQYLNNLKKASIVGFRQTQGKLYLIATGEKPSVSLEIQLIIEGE